MSDKKADMLRLEYFKKFEKYDEAIAFIDELINKGYDYLDEAIIYVVRMLNDNNKVHDKAYHFILRGLTLFPNNMTLKSELCLNLQLRGFQKEAMELCRELTKEYPFSVEIWFLLSELYYDCGDYENAIDSINYAITCAVDEKNSNLTYRLMFMKASYLYKNESYVKSIRTFHELSSYNEFDKVTVFPCLAECYMHIGDFKTAYNILKSVIGQKEIEDKIALYGNFLYCCIFTGHHKEAIEVLCDALKRFPHGILEHLSTLNYALRYKTETDIGNEILVSSSELIRKFLANNAYYN